MDKQWNGEALKAYEGKRVLVTGATGYLGTNLIERLRQVDCHIIRLCRQAAPSLPKDCEGRIEDVVGDISGHEIWKRVMEGVDTVFHFAAQTSAYVANEDPPADLNSNVMPMLHMLEACRRQGRRPIILFSGSVTVAGIPVRLPVDETHPDDPATVYDLHKLMAERYLKWYTSQGIVNGAILRLANVYGPGPKSSRSDRGVLNQMIRKALVGEPLTVYGAGDNLRDYVYVDDVIQAFLHGARNIEAIRGKHFVIGSGQGHTIDQALNLVADRVALKTGNRVKVTHITPPFPQPPIELRNFVADPGSYTRATGWKAECSLAEGIDRSVEALS